MALYLGFDSALFAWLGAKIWRRGGAWRYLGLPALWVALEAQRGIFFNGFRGTSPPTPSPTCRARSAAGGLDRRVRGLVPGGAGQRGGGERLGDAALARAIAGPVAVLLAIVLVLCLAGRFSKAEDPVRGGGREVRLVQPNSAITYQSEKIEQNYRRLLALSVPALHRRRRPAGVAGERGLAGALRNLGAAAPGRGPAQRRRLPGFPQLGRPGGRRVAKRGAAGRQPGDRRPIRQAAAGAVGRIRAAQERFALRRLPGAQRRRVRARPRSRPDGAGLRKAGAGDLLRGDFPQSGGRPGRLRGDHADHRHQRRLVRRYRGALATPAGGPLPGGREPPASLRAALTGVSAIIDAEGRVVAQLGVGEEGVLAARVHGELGTCPYTRAPWLVAALSALLASFAIIRSWRS